MGCLYEYANLLVWKFISVGTTYQITRKQDIG